jgi:methionyl-tRNA formyltransferase
MLGRDNPTTWIVYNHLVRTFGLFPILLEEPVSRKVLFRNRMRKQGLGSAISQVAFIATIRKLLNRRSHAYIEALCARTSMEPARPITSAIINIASVNSGECRDLLTKFSPRIVIVNGTRIIGKETLRTSDAVYINSHHGITPRYRGANGGYWSLYNNDPENCGVTVHVVDEGIDTGNIIAQAVIQTGPNDNFVTYPFLLTQAALPLLSKTIENLRAGTLETRPASGESQVWYHPGLVQYLKARARGIR